MSSIDTHEKGNALFLILIAVALFAALAYAVTQSARSGGAPTTNEQNVIMAAQIVQSAAAAKAGVQRLVLGGVAANAITYATPDNTCPSSPGTPDGVPYGTYNDFCQSGATCLFAPAGGGVPLPVAPAAAFTAHVATFSSISGIGSHVGVSMVGSGVGLLGACNTSAAVSGIGTAASDLVIGWANLTQAVCQAINTGLGISGIPVNTGNWDINAAPGQEAACVKFTGASTLYIYYQVLIAN
jgi:hypothetical protein